MNKRAARSNGRIVRGNIVANMGMQANAVVVSAISVAIYIRVLGGSGYGLWLAIIGLITLGSMADLGIQYAVTQVVAELRGKNLDDDIGHVLTTGFWTVVGVGTVVALTIPLIIFQIHPFSESIHQLGVSQNLVYWLIAIGITSMVLQQAPMVIYAVEFGTERFGMINLIQAGSAWIQLVGVLLLTLVGGVGIIGLLTWFIAWQLVSSMAGVALIARRGHWHIGGFAGYRRAHLKVLAHKGSAFFGTTVANGARSSLDAILISSILGTAYAARYGPSMRIFTLGAVTVPIVFGSLWPTFVRIVQGADRRWVDNAFRLGTTAVLGVGAVISVVMISIGKNLLVGWVGTAGYPGAGVLDVLCVWFMINLWVQVVAYVLIGFGRSPLVMRWTLVEGAVNVGLSILLMKHIGLIGNAIGSASAGLCLAAIPLTFALRRSAGGEVKIPLRLLVATIVVTAITSGAAVGARHFVFPELGAISTVAFGFMCALATGAEFLIVAMPSTDRSMLLGQIRKLSSDLRQVSFRRSV
jgi:O-antigen/teichoic acid export membrane protein